MIENLGAWVAIVALVAGWAIHAAKVSHAWGGLDQRVKAVEATVGGYKDVSDTVIRVETQIQAMSKTLDELKNGLVWMTKAAPLYGPPPPPPKPAARPRR